MFSISHYHTVMFHHGWPNLKHPLLNLATSNCCFLCLYCLTEIPKVHTQLYIYTCTQIII